MARYFKPITIKELEKKIEKCDGPRDGYDDITHLTPTINKDLSKIRFDTENIESNGIGYGAGKGLIGYKTLPNGMSYLGVVAGGDWEEPVFFIIYWDGKMLRGYIPEDGNCYNTDTKEAFGNDHLADIKNAKKRWSERYADVADDYDDYIDPPVDSKKIIADIQKRIIKREDNKKVLKISSSQKPKKKESKSLRDRLEELTFYGTGDEAVELFSSTCHLSYQMSGLGDSEKAQIVFEWAKEQAEDSKKWMIEERGCLDENDTCHGTCW